MEQKGDRRNWIGGSDVAAAIGMNRWKSQLQLWGEKTGKLPIDETDNEAMELGRELEDFVAKKFERKTGFKVRRAPQTYVHPQYPHVRCQVDRLITGKDELLEVKTTSAWRVKEWEGEEIPQEYILQVMWQLGITGRSKGWIAVLIGGQKFRYKQIDFDQEFFDDMVQKALLFWQCVLDKTPPIAVGADNKLMVEFYPTPTSESIQEVEEMETTAGHRQELKMHKKEIEKSLDEVEAKLKQAIGESLGLKTPKYTVIWAREAKNGLNEKALKEAMPEVYTRFYEYGYKRVLRVKLNQQGEINGSK
jgi:putative phage-type endonuclease